MNPLDASTRYCAVYGHPIRHSASPAMQNAGMAVLGLNWRYLAFEVHPDRLQEALTGAQAMHFIGLNLTVPHKVLAVDMMDVLDASAVRWGAVNTVRFEAQGEDGQWRPVAAWEGDVPDRKRMQGFNTDADAIVRSLEEDLGLALAGTSVLVLGTGGAGRVAALRLADAGVKRLHLVNRTQSKAEEVAREMERAFSNRVGPGPEVSVGYPRDPVDLVLNATSLGLREGDAMPLDPGVFSLKEARAVYDMIYRPAETPLLRAAREAGCRVANGLGMLLYQGARALEIWTGRSAPIMEMKEALRRNIYGH